MGRKATVYNKIKDDLISIKAVGDSVLIKGYTYNQIYQVMERHIEEEGITDFKLKLVKADDGFFVVATSLETKSKYQQYRDEFLKIKKIADTVFIETDNTNYVLVCINRFVKTEGKFKLSLRKRDGGCIIVAIEELERTKG